jgi:hypothetical protein
VPTIRRPAGGAFPADESRYHVPAADLVGEWPGAQSRRQTPTVKEVAAVAMSHRR